ncbi:conserved hypothetical protein [Sporisorium reilianum SRZ2]|uniref:PH domain-containing protein n=1 Tax=Sporisorium reilianum (strain SRZ2) TaxID=999809 RepID=E7A3D9_SPORE|nr:conserved hypothetical protein [Sporisorium reilianum SRZ2]
MDGSSRPAHVQAGTASEHSASFSLLATASAPLQHRPSLATTRSTSSASSSSHRSFPATLAAPRAASASSTSSSAHASPSPSRKSSYSDTVQSPKTRTHPKPARRLPVYVRIVPKDIWLRIHVTPSQTIGSIKDTALFAANAPDHDPSLSYRFYQDAVNASAHAKIAPVAGHDRVAKHRTYALPRSFLCPPPDLSDVVASITASMANTGLSSKSPRMGSNSVRGFSGVSQPPPVPPVPPMPTFDNAYSPRQAQVALPSASTSQQTLLHGSASPLSRSTALPVSSTFGGGTADGSNDVTGSSSAHIARQISNSTLATSAASTASDGGAATSSGSTNNAALSSDASASDTSLSESHPHSHAVSEIAIRLDASLITGDRNAKLEEDQARSRLTQWSARRESTGTAGAGTVQREAGLSVGQMHSSPRRKSSPAHSYTSTPTMGSSSTFGSPNMAASLSSSNVHAGSSSPHNDGLHATAATPPRRPHRLNAGPAPAIFYTQPGACESFASLASVGSPSAVDLVTTADDDALVMQWGTQAEASPGSDAHSSPPRVAGAAFAPLSSPLQPSTALLSGSPSSVSSSARPRSKTVTAADVLRSRAARDEVPHAPPPLPSVMPGAITSPARNSSLPRPAGKKLVAEPSQRREGPQLDLLELLKGSARDDFDDDDDDDDGGGGFATIKQRSSKVPTLLTAMRKNSSDGSAASAASAAHAAVLDNEQYLAGIRLDGISRGWKDASHPLSSKYAVLSSANGCELDEWKTVAASLVRPYELLELQWSIPTERVYIPPISLHDTIRAASSPATATAASSSKGLFKQTWGQEANAGPDADAPCLEPYFEGWVYILKGTEKAAKGSSKMGKWKLHWMTVKGWRVDLYRKKPRAGEAVLPVAEQVWSLRAIDWVAVDAEHAVPVNAALPGLDAMPRCSVTVAFPPKSAAGGAATPPSWMVSSSAGSLAAGEAGSMLTLRCISHFDHEALSTLLLRAWYRCSAAATSSSVDNWRRKAVFRAMVAGRGGTVAAGRTRGARNARARTRMRPSGWRREWEDAEQWSSESEREEVAPPAELEHALSVQQQQARRGTVTQAKADQSAAQRSGRRGDVVPGGMYAALSGIASASARPRHLAQSPSLPHLEPGLMVGSTSAHLASNPAARRRRQSGGSSRSPDTADRVASITSLRSRSFTASSPDAHTVAAATTSSSSSSSSRNASRDASPMRSSGSSSRKGSTSANAYSVSPALVPGFVDVLPPPSAMLLKKFKASQKAAQSAAADVDGDAV